MTPLRVPLYYDFASTLCYVAHRVLERMKGDLHELGVELVWSPLDLTQLTGWNRGDAVEGKRRENALRVARELKVDLRMPDHWIDSRPLHAVGLALEGTPAEVTWRERVFSAVYEEGRPADEPAELERLGRDLALDAPALNTRRQREALEVRTLLAAEAGVTGVPTFMLGEWPIGGIQEESTMRSLLGRYVARQRASGVGRTELG